LNKFIQQVDSQNSNIFDTVSEDHSHNFLSQNTLAEALHMESGKMVRNGAMHCDADCCVVHFNFFQIVTVIHMLNQSANTFFLSLECDSTRWCNKLTLQSPHNTFVTVVLFSMDHLKQRAKCHMFASSKERLPIGFFFISSFQL